MTFRKFAEKTIKTSMQPLCNRFCDFNRFIPLGHFYSPMPNSEDYDSIHALSGNVEADWRELEEQNNSTAGIEFNESAQLQLLAQLGDNYKTRPNFPVNKTDNIRFRFNNHYYSYADATVFYCLINRLRPRKIVDVGGGNTTRLMLDMNDTCFKDAPMHITLVEPYPERIEGYMGSETALDKIYSKVQHVDLNVFRSLEAGDVLFLDTTHVSKMGSEIHYLAFKIFPLLKPGVVIHIHEIFYPFEYPASFYAEGKFWNEIYMWRAFLMHNKEYEILLFNSWLSKKHPEILRKHMPDFFRTGRPDVNVQNEGSSLWLRKLGSPRCEPPATGS
jgi:hypothetical protein